MELQETKRLEDIVEDKDCISRSKKLGVSLINFYQKNLSKYNSLPYALMATIEYTGKNIKKQGIKGVVSGFKSFNEFLKNAPSICLYSPTCSEYTKKAVIKYGLINGSYKGMKRILSCNPLTYYFRRKKDHEHCHEYPLK